MLLFLHDAKKINHFITNMRILEKVWRRTQLFSYFKIYTFFLKNKFLFRINFFFLIV